MASGPLFSAGRPAAKGLGQVEYRLARDSIVREYRRGRLSRLDVCDAQRELLRVAEHHGTPTAETCPICEEATLVHVSFAFGPRLPASGRAVGSQRELRALARDGSDVSFYVVEVCAACGWNHLVRMFSSPEVRRRSPSTER
ncbi:MAG: DUF5318 family protein [Actinomycetota bacterium]|nr:DUF5318 family protein [Actinomycetota bacterium]MDA8281766.1 DUF5318 family protein [Actinomycetota bacterium]